MRSAAWEWNILHPTFIDQMSAEIITIIYQLGACVTLWNRVNKLSKGVANKNLKMQMGGACMLLEFSGAACRRYCIKHIWNCYFSTRWLISVCASDCGAQSAPRWARRWIKPEPLAELWIQVTEVKRSQALISGAPRHFPCTPVASWLWVSYNNGCL